MTEAGGERGLCDGVHLHRNALTVTHVPFSVLYVALKRKSLHFHLIPLTWLKLGVEFSS